MLTLSEVAYLQINQSYRYTKSQAALFQSFLAYFYRHFVLETDVLINAVPEQIIDHELIQYHRPVRNIAG